MKAKFDPFMVATSAPTACPPVLVIHGSNRCASFARMPAPTALCPLQHPAFARVLTSLLCRRPGALALPRKHKMVAMVPEGFRHWAGRIQYVHAVAVIVFRIVSEVGARASASHSGLACVCVHC